MEQLPQALINLWRTRSSNWFAKNYEDAAERIEVLPSSGGELFIGQTDEDYIGVGGIVDNSGSTMPFDEARAKAFEILILCDIAEFKD